MKHTFFSHRAFLRNPILILALLMSPILSRADDDHNHDEEIPDASEIVILTEKQAEVLKVEVFESHDQPFEQTIHAMGEIEVMPGSRAVVSSRIPGRAESIMVKKDQIVQQGDEVLWVESRQPGDPPPVIRLEAPISGVVSEVKINQGQPISPEDVLVELINLEQVHAAAYVPEALIDQIKIGQKARIRIASFAEPIEAEVAHLSPIATRENGTVEVSFHLPNPDLKIRPGMFAEFTIITSEEEDVTLIPNEAILNRNSTPFVFVKDFDLPNAWSKAFLELGRSNDQYTEVLSGLFPGDEIAVKGSFALNAMGGGGVSLKEALDAAHGHSHNEDGSEIKEGESSPDAAATSPVSKEVPFWNPSSIIFAAMSGFLFLVLILVTFCKKASPHEA